MLPAQGGREGQDWAEAVRKAAHLGSPSHLDWNSPPEFQLETFGANIRTQHC